jgi:hypothetical protein
MLVLKSTEPNDAEMRFREAYLRCRPWRSKYDISDGVG